MAGKKDSKYNRILLKLSGEALAPVDSIGIDASAIDRFAEEVKSAHDLGVEIALVIGGGNIFRGLRASADGMDRTTADHMGMLGTVINALALQDALEKKGIFTRVMSSIHLTQIAEPYIRRRACRHLEKGRIVIFAAGTGNPYFTTDTAASLRAMEINADVILKSTRVDGVYDSDPEKNKDAKRFDKLQYLDALQKNLGVMDATAISLCMDNQLPIIVFNGNTKGNLLKLLKGEAIGTTVN